MNRNAVANYLVLVVLLSIPFWILGAAYPIQLMPGLPLSALAVLVPASSAFILTYRSDRWTGVWALLRRSFDFGRVEKRWWLLVILLVNPAIALLAFMIINARESLPPISTSSVAILGMFVLFFVSALGEELGWMGYAAEPLQRRWGTLAAGLIVGVIWVVWHYIPLLQVQRPIGWILWWSLNSLSLRVIMLWFYAYTGKSVFAAALFHTMINLCWQLFPIQGSHFDPQVFGIIAFFFAIILYAVDWLIIGSNRSTQSGLSPIASNEKRT